MDTKIISDIEQTIGYTFKNKMLLEQAFVRKSYSKEHPDTLDNEKLEFYGDEALDFYVTRSMFYQFSSVTKNRQFYSDKTEEELTNIKSYNVDTESLAHCIWITGFQNYLLMNKSDKKNNAENSPSVMADLFEAIVGAVVVDSDWEYESFSVVCKSLLNLSHFEINYIKWIKDWCAEKGFELYLRPVLNFTGPQLFSEPYYGLGVRNPFTGQIDYKYKAPSFASCIGGSQLIIREANIKVESKIKNEFNSYMDCAKQAYKIIRDREMKESVGEPDYNTAVNQLNILYQKGFIKEPKYDFKEEHDKDGNPIWVCDCSLCELEDTYYEETPIKKESKKGAAYGALCALLGYDPEDD